jgi:hypothetical protein
MLWKKSLIVLLCLLWTTAVAAQSSCEILMQEATTSMRNGCTVRDRVCHEAATTTFEMQPFAYEANLNHIIGIGADMTDIKSVKTEAMDVKKKLWGLTTLALPADRRDAPLDEILFVTMYGEGTLTPLGYSQASINAAPDVPLTIYRTPSEQGTVIEVMPRSILLPADGRLADSSWIRMPMPTGGIGWVKSSEAVVRGDLASLPVRTADDVTIDTTPTTIQYVGGRGRSACSQVPQGGLMMQTSYGVTSVVVINNIELTFEGALAARFLEYPPSNPNDPLHLVFYILSGSIKKVAFTGDKARTFDLPDLPGGSVLSVPIDDAGYATGEDVFTLPEFPEISITLDKMALLMLDPLVHEAPHDPWVMDASLGLPIQEATWEMMARDEVPLCLDSGLPQPETYDLDDIGQIASYLNGEMTFVPVGENLIYKDAFSNTQVTTVKTLGEAFWIDTDWRPSDPLLFVRTAPNVYMAPQMDGTVMEFTSLSTVTVTQTRPFGYYGWGGPDNIVCQRVRYMSDGFIVAK